MDLNVSMESVAGFKMAATAAGFKKSGKPDLGIIVAEKPAAAAGVFTKNKVVSPSVGVTKRHLAKAKGMARAIVVNAGCANTCTGEEGRKNAEKTAQLAADLVRISPNEVMVCSTGVIGHQLDMNVMAEGLLQAGRNLERGGGAVFSQAIMTTDLVEKRAGIVVDELGGVTIAGCCKGSGMIAPNMATMLGFILTDMAVSSDVLKKTLIEVCDLTFNCVTVDGDTSTNDSVLIMASGAKGGKTLTQTSGKRYNLFRDALYKVCLALSEKIAADGEGATKLVRVKISGAASLKDAKRAAKTVAESPLVKTAMYGNDPNWGRILAALGRSGCKLIENKVKLHVAETMLFEHGAPCEFTASDVSKAMKTPEVVIDVNLGLGKGEAMMMTCDYSYDYIKINAEYHT